MFPGFSAEIYLLTIVVSSEVLTSLKALICSAFGTSLLCARVSTRVKSPNHSEQEYDIINQTSEKQHHLC